MASQTLRWFCAGDSCDYNFGLHPASGHSRGTYH